MSKYTTGEVAALCNVSVRTVQYYDSRDILIPSEFTEGGRRLYSEEDLEKLKVICFLREIGLSINAIGRLLKEHNSKKVVSCILEEQARMLKREISDKSEKLAVVEKLLKSVTDDGEFSLNKISDMASVMDDKKKLRRVRANIIIAGIAIEALEIAAIVLWAVLGLWIPFAVVMPVAVVAAILISKYYFNSVRYICPECKAVFKPKFKQAFFAVHTPTTRKLTCPNCGNKGYCVETCKEKTV